jgi:signal transduction histidine kinase
LLDNQAVLSRELQLRRKDGTPVWVLFNAAALNSEHNIPILQSTMIDISEWKRAEEDLLGMTRKLVAAQEQERARIGRELHDDINQRLAMLSVELDQLQQSPTEVQSRVEQFRKELREISDDVQAISHDLHSSKLEYLGVISGIKSWCREVADRHKIEVVFKSDFSGNLPLDIGLPLFRVLQEAVINSIKHSGEKRVEVQLWKDSGEIHIMVRDSGKGFDIETALRGKGLGLTSMRERVRLVNGTIAIESSPMGGTKIHMCIPLGQLSNAERLSA